MKKIGVVICNYNKADYVVECVDKILNQTFTDMDIVVVDNASTDDSVLKLRQGYGERIKVIENVNNLGGAGGFQKGIEWAIGNGYVYTMLVDNDAMLSGDAMEILNSYLDGHGDVGFCGAKTLVMKDPQRIQDLGGYIDESRYYRYGAFGGGGDVQGELILEMDYVASCALLCRTEILQRIGGMSVENFIYWDDIEMCARCRNLGFKVVVHGMAVAYHDISGGGKKNTFLKYYVERNRMKYFSEFLSDDKIEDFYDHITRELFSKLYGYFPKKEYALAYTNWNAFEDFLFDRFGKAADGRIPQYSKEISDLERMIGEWKSIKIMMPEHTVENYNDLRKVVAYVTGRNAGIKIEVRNTDGADDLCDTNVLRKSDHSYKSVNSENADAMYDAVLVLCTHVTEVKNNILPRIYIDRFLNTILSERDYYYFQNYPFALENFQKLHRPQFMKEVEILKKREEDRIQW